MIERIAEKIMIEDAVVTVEILYDKETMTPYTCVVFRRASVKKEVFKITHEPILGTFKFERIEEVDLMITAAELEKIVKRTLKGKVKAFLSETGIRPEDLSIICKQIITENG